MLVHLGTGQDHKSKFVVIERKNDAKVFFGVTSCEGFLVYSLVFVA